MSESGGMSEQSNSAPAIETRGLTKRFGTRTPVDGVDLLVPRACAFGFLGPNGAGKTTMIRMLLGLTGASGGEMSLLGYPVPAQRGGAPRAGARIAPRRAGVGLAERGEDRVRRYSWGMRQRPGVARCLLADPQLLIL